MGTARFALRSLVRSAGLSGRGGFGAAQCEHAHALCRKPKFARMAVGDTETPYIGGRDMFRQGEGAAGAGRNWAARARRTVWISASAV